MTTQAISNETAHMKTRLTRDAFLPREPCEEVTREGLNAVVYLYERDGKVFAAGFEGKAAKPKFRYYFQTPEQRAAHVGWFFDKAADRQSRRCETAKLRSSFDATEHFAEGDVIVNSWGYDQTNVDFYVVQKVCKKFLTLRECAQQKSGDVMQGSTVPLPQTLTGEPFRAAAYEWEPKRFGVNFKYGAGRKWEGRPESFSSYH